MEDDVVEDKTAPATNGTLHPTSSSILPSILSPLLELIQPTSLSFPPPGAPSPHPPTTSALSAIHIAALECLNNVFLALAASPNPAVTEDVSAGTRAWEAVWAALSAAGTEGGLGQESRLKLWEVAVGVLWAAGSVWSGKLVRQSRLHAASLALIPLKPADEERIKVLMQLCDTQSDDAVRVKVIGTLESIAQRPDAIDANRVRFYIHPSQCVFSDHITAGHRKLPAVFAAVGRTALTDRHRAHASSSIIAHRYILRRGAPVRCRFPRGSL